MDGGCRHKDARGSNRGFISKRDDARSSCPCSWGSQIGNCRCGSAFAGSRSGKICWPRLLSWLKDCRCVTSKHTRRLHVRMDGGCRHKDARGSNRGFISKRDDADRAVRAVGALR